VATGNGEHRGDLPLRVPEWGAIPDLAHGFLGRAHSLPPGSFARADLHRVLSAGGEAPVLILATRQVHGNVVRAPEDLELACGTDAATLPETLPDGDAIVTASADTIATIRTADCVPILLVAPRARAAATVHAGWRGLAAGVVAEAVTALGLRYAARPDEIQAAIGPAIGGCCYEFGAEHHPVFARLFGPDADPAWSEGATGRPHLDVRILARLALTQTGVPTAAIHTLGPCTADHPDHFHSYRRDGPQAGRQLSYIGWRS
jgi:hypothetical protein